MWKLLALSQKKNVENSRNTEIPCGVLNKECSWFCPKWKFFVVKCRAAASTNTLFLAIHTVLRKMLLLNSFGFSHIWVLHNCIHLLFLANTFFLKRWIKACPFVHILYSWCIFVNGFCTRLGEFSEQLVGPMSSVVSLSLKVRKELKNHSTLIAYRLQKWYCCWCKGNVVHTTYLLYSELITLKKTKTKNHRHTHMHAHTHKSLLLQIQTKTASVCSFTSQCIWKNEA